MDLFRLTNEDTDWINSNLDLARQARNGDRVYPPCGHQVGGPCESWELRDCPTCNHYIIHGEFLGAAAVEEEDDGGDDDEPIDWRDDLGVALVEGQTGEIVGWPEGGRDPDWDRYYIYLPDPINPGNNWKITRTRPASGSMPRTRLMFIATNVDTNTRWPGCLLWDTWRDALAELMGEPSPFLDEGDGHYRYRFGSDDDPQRDLVVEPEPGGGFRAFIDPPLPHAREYLGDDPVEAALAVFDLA